MDCQLLLKHIIFILGNELSDSKNPANSSAFQTSLDAFEECWQKDSTQTTLEH